ncbi:MAG: PilX N-terminal domain-containing pilus assembly protein [Gammaproteobacteria bacterium]|nr:PilX N-terminal domain-containing pilus assembly protein [Gammaproteobacteria bacterium]
MRSIHFNRYPTMHRQQGVALVMSMAFLLILTLIGITALNTSALEERMAGNMVDKNYALQAAESALLAGEALIPPLGGVPPLEPPNPTDGFHLPSTTAAPRWAESTGVWAGTDYISYAGLTKVATQPKFIIEHMGQVSTGNDVTAGEGYGGSGSPDMEVFRITARGTGSSDNAQSMVQSTYEILF